MSVSALKPSFITHDHALDSLNNETTVQDLMDSIEGIEVNYEMEVDLGADEGEGARSEYEIRYCFQIISQAHSSQNIFKGTIVSILQERIFKLAAAKNAARHLGQIVNEPDLKSDPNLQEVIKKTRYISKNIASKYLFNFKKQSKGISLPLFLAGVGMLMNACYNLSRFQSHDQSDGDSQEDPAAAWIQLSLGISFVATPILRALFKTVTN